MSRPLVVAEVGINHNGNLALAKSIVATSQAFGADYVKFQKRTVEEVYDQGYLQQNRPSSWGVTQRDQKHGLEFGKQEYDEIDRYCKTLGMKWFATPMDPTSARFIASYSPEFLKVASFDLTNMKLLEQLKAEDIPLIVSTGMSTKEQIDRAVDYLGDQVQFLLHCVSSYPTPETEMNMRRLATLQKYYGDRYKIGFSNHSVHLIYTVQAAVMGAEMLEFHVTIDRNLGGSDQFVSMGPTGFKRIVDHLNHIEEGWGDGSLSPQPSEAGVCKKLRRFP